MPITLRQATLSDHASIAELCRTAFFDEDLFGRVMHPRRQEFPQDVGIFWLGYVRERWIDWRNSFVVAVDEEGKVVGVAIWQKQRESDEERWDWGNIALTPLLTLHTNLTSSLYPNRALDPSTLSLLPNAFPHISHYWAGPRASNYYLDLLAVSPSSQNLGIGKQLTKWGLEKAKEEGVCASVLGSEGSEAFYLKCGFDRVVGRADEGEGNPLRERGVKGGAILFMFAEGVD